MRVLHVIPAVAPCYGGTSAAVLALTRSQRESSRYLVDIATTDANGVGKRLAADSLPQSAARLHVFRRDWSEQLKYSRDLGHWLRARAADYDLLHIHSNWNLPVAAACNAAWRARVPFILSPHGMLSDYSWGRSKWKKRIYWPLVERRNVFRSSAFHVTSDEERREVSRLGVDAPIEVIALGVDDEAFDTPIDVDWLRRQCPESGDRPIVLFLSRLHPKKGITDFLLPALARMRTDAFLAIIGGDDAHAHGFSLHIKSEIGRLKLTGRAALLGAVPANQRWAAFDGADIFVLPSYAENFGIVVPEAMARGKPAVVTTGVQFAEHVAKSRGGSVVCPDIGELAESLDYWLVNPSARERAGKLATQYIQNHFSWSRTTAELENLYQRVCVKPR